MCCSNYEAQQQKPPDLDKGKSKLKKFAKIVLLGNVAVGKTSITQRFCFEKFEEKHYNTLGGAYVEKNVENKNGENIQLNIWDTAGDERYRSIMPLYYRDATVALLVYDVTDMNSFQDLNYWIDELESKVKTDGMILAIVGNKNDVQPQEKLVSTHLAESFAREKNLIFGECSAKTGEGINKIFNNIIEQICLQQNSKQSYI